MYMSFSDLQASRFIRFTIETAWFARFIVFALVDDVLLLWEETFGPAGVRVQGLGSRLQGLGLRIWDLGFRV